MNAKQRLTLLEDTYLGRGLCQCGAKVVVVRDGQTTPANIGEAVPCEKCGLNNQWVVVTVRREARTDTTSL